MRNEEEEEECSLFDPINNHVLLNEFKEYGYRGIHHTYIRVHSESEFLTQQYIYTYNP